MSRVRSTIPYLLAAFLLFAGIAKFLHHDGAIFPTLEAEIGLGLIHPAGQYAVGVLELAAGTLVAVRSTRHRGALLALAVFGGAALLHLSPWLGVAPPTGIVDGAEGPWTDDDFLDHTSPRLFVAALGGTMLAVTVAATSGARRTEPTQAVT